MCFSTYIWWNIHADLSSIFLYKCLSGILVFFFLANIFLPVCILSFCFLSGIFQRSYVFHFEEVRFIKFLSYESCLRNLCLKQDHNSFVFFRNVIVYKSSSLLYMWDICVDIYLFRHRMSNCSYTFFSIVPLWRLIFILSYLVQESLCLFLY